jgi:magnesium-transporting ATPase (P-type)
MPDKMLRFAVIFLLTLIFLLIWLRESQKLKTNNNRKAYVKSRRENLWGLCFILSFLPALAGFSFFPLVSRYTGFMDAPNWWWIVSFALSAFVAKVSFPFVFNAPQEPVNLAVFYVVATPMFAFIGVGWLTLFNGFLDGSSSRTLEQIVSSMDISRNKQGTSHYVYVSDWQKPQSTVRLSVGRDFYQRIQIGTKIQVTTKPGLLGAEWVADIRAAPP